MAGIAVVDARGVPQLELTLDEIHAVTAYAVACARPAMALGVAGRGRAGVEVRALDAALR
jgi:hypothetical protein